jgi:hypothetical protein
MHNIFFIYIFLFRGKKGGGEGDVEREELEWKLGVKF